MPIFDILNNGVVRVVLLGTLFLGILSGILGVFTLLKKQALIGDTLSHATLPGVVLMFIFTTSKNISVLLIGAAISAALAMGIMMLIKKYSKINNDAILALILSSFFGLGRFLISLISRNPKYSGARLDDFIFGSAATIIESDVITLMVVLLVVLVIIIFTWRNLKLQTFDKDFYQSVGYSNLLIDFIMSFMTILVIVVGIRTVGVILMSALLIVPGLAARQWSDKLLINVILAGVFGALASVFGTLYSVSYEGGIPTGPVIVIIGTAIAIISLLFAPRKGIISKEIARINHRNDLKRYQILIHLYEVKEERDDYYLQSNLKEHINNNLIEVNNGLITLTNQGHNKVVRILRGDRK